VKDIWNKPEAKVILDNPQILAVSIEHDEVKTQQKDPSSSKASLPAIQSSSVCAGSSSNGEEAVIADAAAAAVVVAEWSTTCPPG
jgi:hypothetical protein